MDWLYRFLPPLRRRRFISWANEFLVLHGKLKALWQEGRVNKLIFDFGSNFVCICTG
jgi:hypothetical protein